MIPIRIGGAVLGGGLLLLLGTMVAGCGGGGGSSGGSLTGTGSGSGSGSGSVFPGGVAVWHQVIALKDSAGNGIQAGSTTPYSPRKTCGGCHDVDSIASGYHFQQGRTSTAGAIQTKNDFFGDGRGFVRSPGMYGRWCPASLEAGQLAAKTNTTASALDKTSFDWTANCAVCHPGGGPGEFDRDGKKYFDPLTSQFGYQAMGLTAGQVTLDGDYATLNQSNGAVSAARWDVTGVAEPDCLMCHRSEMAAQPAGIGTGPSLNWQARAGTQRGSTALQDASGNTVKAFTAASSAGQGWISTYTAVPGANPPRFSVVQIDYGKGVADGSLVQGSDGSLRVNPAAVAKTPRDLACWSCHVTPDLRRADREWFNKDSDVHYASLNHLDDTTSGNDIPATSSTACVYCHSPRVADLPGGLTRTTHDPVKGNSAHGNVADDLDYTQMRTCADCHLAGASHDPNAPTPDLDDTGLHNPRHLAVLACQACHVPYRDKAGDLVVDNATTGNSITYSTAQFLSADPLNPAAADKSKWYPSFKLKLNKSGQSQLYPQRLELTAWWGDWNQKGTVDRNDDVITPIALWRVRGVTGGQALAGVVDNNADGILEVNTKAEILLYINALKGATDTHGTAVASAPVLVKAGKVYYEDALAAGGVNFFTVADYLGLKAESAISFDQAHNVLKTNRAMGSGSAGSCGACHGSSNRKFFDRKVLVDPFDLTGTAVYSTVDAMNPGIAP